MYYAGKSSLFSLIMIMIKMLSSCEINFSFHSLFSEINRRFVGNIIMAWLLNRTSKNIHLRLEITCEDYNPIYIQHSCFM